MTRLPAYAITGRELTADALRVFGYAATAGQRGIASPTDFKVEAIGGASVRVNPGGAVMPTRFVSSPQYHSYAVAMDSAENVAIPATGSGGGATRYVIARIHDEQYGGGSAPAPNWTLEVVSSIATLPYPFVEFAKINQPASTSVITAAMIEDVRTIARPRTERHVKVVPVPVNQTMDGSSFVNFGGTVELTTVPFWANRVIVRADLIGVVNQVANLDGQFAISFGSKVLSTRRFDINWNGQTERHDFTMVGEANIADKALLEQSLRVRARRMNGTGKLFVDTSSATMFEYEFIEDIA